MAQRRLSEQDLDDILLGAAVLGTGGGGEIAEGKARITEALAAGKSFVLVDPEDVPDDAVICTPYMLGALSDVSPDQDPAYARLPRATRNPLLLAYDRFQEHLGRKFHGVVACELGGSNTAAAFYCAAMNGHVIVDGDPSGRAVPEIQHTTYNLAGLAPGDLVLANAFGERFVFENVHDDHRAEDIARALAIASCNDIAAIDHALPMGTLRHALIGGTISKSLELGRAMRGSRNDGTDLAEVIADTGSGTVVFRGSVTDCASRTDTGFTVGEFTLANDRGETYRIAFKNENMCGFLNYAVSATIPDLICVLDLERHEPVTNPNVRIGAQVAVVVLPAPDAFLTPEGLALFGPAYAGLSHEYQPFWREGRS